MSDILVRLTPELDAYEFVHLPSGEVWRRVTVHELAGHERPHETMYRAGQECVRRARVRAFAEALGKLRQGQ